MFGYATLLLLALFCVFLSTTTSIIQNRLIGPIESTRGKLLQKHILTIRGGFGGGGATFENADNEDDDDDLHEIELTGSRNKLDGVYIRAEDVNGRPHYEKNIEGDVHGDRIHLYWSGHQWILHYDLDPSRNFDNLLAYAKVRAEEPQKSSSFWNVRIGKVYQPSPHLVLRKPGSRDGEKRSAASATPAAPVKELMGVPRQLFPLYISFMLDAIAVGLAMPLLPFYVMELGANALQLSMVVSANYVAQMIGCLVMGQVSDRFGRKIVLFLCLLASSLSYFFVSKARTLETVAAARIISGSMGGLLPVMQSCVADVTSQSDRPKYLGRIMATFGMGFVLGPALSASLPSLSTREKIRLSALLPLTGLVVSLLFFRETKKGLTDADTDDAVPGAGVAASQPKKIAVAGKDKNKPKPRSQGVRSSVLLLVLNGFLLMYAFATETIYAMFMKDSFGYGERALSTLFAVNGLFIGLFQVFFIKPMVNLIGKHATLAVGNAILALGMVGIALIRTEWIHFSMFAGHIVGYSIADTALASLISRYSAPSTQGRDLAFNQAAQACARVLSPLFAGLLYERSKQSGKLPVGALPFLAGAAFPALGVTIPALLYIRSVSRKRALKAEEAMFEAARDK
jgi:DHA1 family tetracycline resistance protein-like MFS transporter